MIYVLVLKQLMVDFPDFFPMEFVYHHQFSPQLVPLQDKYQVISQTLTVNMPLVKHTDYFRILPVIMSVTYLFTFIEYIDLTQEPDNPVVEYWMKDFQLYPSDKGCITGGKWLIDSIIMAGQKLLRMAHPNMGGLQPHLR